MHVPDLRVADAGSSKDVIKRPPPAATGLNGETGLHAG